MDEQTKSPVKKNPVKGLVVAVADFGVGSTLFALAAGRQP